MVASGTYTTAHWVGSSQRLTPTFGWLSEAATSNGTSRSFTLFRILAGGSVSSGNVRSSKALSWTAFVSGFGPAKSRKKHARGPNIGTVNANVAARLFQWLSAPFAFSVGQ